MPLGPGSFYTEDNYTRTYRPCPDPHEIPSDTPAPASRAEASELWQAARDASQAREELTVTLPWITAMDWVADGEAFSVSADVREAIDVHGPGVYRLVLWGPVDGERTVISEYAVFHGIEPPVSYE